MKKFISRTTLFLLPFLFLAINYSGYQESGGDLCRLGKITINRHYRDKWQTEFKRKKQFINLSSYRYDLNDTIDILTIGDSFSQINSYGYQNYLSSNYHLSVCNVGSKYLIDNNAILSLNSLIDNKLFDSINVRYIVLQCIERNIVWKGLNVFASKTISQKKLVVNEEFSLKKTNSLGQVRNFIDYFSYSILYNFDDKAFFSQIYKFELTKNVFTFSPNMLLCFVNDISNISNKDQIIELNTVFNTLALKLKLKNIKLIVMPTPDKYDMYFEFIKDCRYPKNIFFDVMKKEAKKYDYIDLKEIFLEKSKNGIKDIYFVDDQHWSPIGHQIVAELIAQEIKKGSLDTLLKKHSNVY